MFLLSFSRRFLCYNLTLFVRVFKAVPLLQIVWVRAVSTAFYKPVPLLQFDFIRACLYRAFQGGSSVAICLGSCVFLLSFPKRSSAAICLGLCVFLQSFPRRFLCCNLTLFMRVSTELFKAIPLLQFVWGRACFSIIFSKVGPLLEFD